MVVWDGDIDDGFFIIPLVDDDNARFVVSDGVVRLDWEVPQDLGRLALLDIEVRQITYLNLFKISNNKKLKIKDLINIIHNYLKK